MVIAFKQQFVQPILDGTKIHTMRNCHRTRWFKGRIMNMSTCVRTKKQYEFNTTWCTGTQLVEFFIDGEQDRLGVSIDGRVIRPDEVILLAKNDGFANTNEMFEWFEYKPTSVVLIHWTDFRY